MTGVRRGRGRGEGGNCEINRHFNLVLKEGIAFPAPLIVLIFNFEVARNMRSRIGRKNTYFDSLNVHFSFIKKHFLAHKKCIWNVLLYDFALCRKTLAERNKSINFSRTFPTKDDTSNESERASEWVGSGSKRKRDGKGKKQEKVPWDIAFSAIKKEHYWFCLQFFHAAVLL